MAHTGCAEVAASREPEDAVSDLEDTLALVKGITKKAGMVTISEAKGWLRSRGDRGAWAASQLGKLSSKRNHQSQRA